MNLHRLRQKDNGSLDETWREQRETNQAKFNTFSDRIPSPKSRVNKKFGSYLCFGSRSSPRHSNKMMSISRSSFTFRTSLLPCFSQVTTTRNVHLVASSKFSCGSCCFIVLFIVFSKRKKNICISLQTVGWYLSNGKWKVAAWLLR